MDLSFYMTSTITWTLTYFVIMTTICCDAHWTEVTRANPLYTVYQERASFGLWYRCLKYGNGGYECILMMPTIQILPGYLILNRVCVVISIILAFVAFWTSIAAHPNIRYKFSLGRKKFFYKINWYLLVHIWNAFVRERYHVFSKDIL